LIPFGLPNSSTLRDLFIMENQPNRRGFIKSSTTAAAGAALLP
jgi:hypothetical protein